MDFQVLRELIPDLVGQPTSGRRAAASEPAPHPALREYITLHGQTDFRFTSLPEGTEILGHAIVADSPYDSQPAAFYVEVEKGSLLVLPYHSAGDFAVLFDRLVEGVVQYQEGRFATRPPFFDDLQLPGEDQVLRGIDAAQKELDNLEVELARLIRHKLLVGHFSGEALEQLVIEELNVVLQESDVIAQDVQERGVEDFELVDASSNRHAIAESKAARRGVTLEHVNQINSHRTELFDAAAEELPGLLVVNTFRNDPSLERRREPVDGRIIRSCGSDERARASDVGSLSTRHAPLVQ